MKERYTVRIAVFLLLEKIDENSNKRQILLQKRQNTGYMDNMYDAGASGHLDPNETIQKAVKREALEEIGIMVEEKDLELVLTYHASEEKNGIEYLRFYFAAKKYSGELKICEPNKCSELIWCDIDNLPSNTIWHFKNAVSNYSKGNNYCED